MTRPTQTTRYEGNRRIKCFSYVVTLCEIGGDQVKAVRIDDHSSKFDLYKVVEKDYPGWKLKNILRLYKEDFEK